MFYKLSVLQLRKKLKLDMMPITTSQESFRRLAKTFPKSLAENTVSEHSDAEHLQMTYKGAYKNYINQRYLSYQITKILKNTKPTCNIL